MAENGNQTTAVETKEKDPRAVQTYQALLAREKMLGQLLPKGYTVSRFIRQVMLAIARNPKLLNCAQNGSLVQAALEAASVGIDCSGVLGHGYLVPYWTKTDGHKAQFIPGYRGLVDLARRSGDIETISADVVWEGDKFNYVKGDNESITHVPDLEREIQDDEIPLYAYAIARLKDGGIQRCVMSRRDVEKIRKKSLSKARDKDNPSLPWNEFVDEMYRKTAVRRLFKMLPVSTERLQRALEQDEMSESDMLSLDHVAGAIGGSQGSNGDKDLSERAQAVMQAMDQAERPNQKAIDPVKHLPEVEEPPMPEDPPLILTNEPVQPKAETPSQEDKIGELAGRVILEFEKGLEQGILTKQEFNKAFEKVNDFCSESDYDGLRVFGNSWVKLFRERSKNKASAPQEIIPAKEANQARAEDLKGRMIQLMNDYTDILNPASHERAAIVARMNELIKVGSFQDAQELIEFKAHEFQTARDQKRAATVLVTESSARAQAIKSRPGIDGSSLDKEFLDYYPKAAKVIMTKQLDAYRTDFYKALAEGSIDKSEAILELIKGRVRKFSEGTEDAVASVFKDVPKATKNSIPMPTVWEQESLAPPDEFEPEDEEQEAEQAQPEPPRAFAKSSTDPSFDAFLEASALVRGGGKEGWLTETQQEMWVEKLSSLFAEKNAQGIRDIMDAIKTARKVQGAKPAQPDQQASAAAQEEPKDPDSMAIDKRVLGYLKSQDAPQTSIEIQKGTKFGIDTVSKSLKRLGDAGKIDRTGEKRGTRYAAVKAEETGLFDHGEPATLTSLHHQARTLVKRGLEEEWLAPAQCKRYFQELDHALEHDQAGKIDEIHTEISRQMARLSVR